MASCANGCNRKALPGERFCRSCSAGDVPLVHPGLLPDAYLQACALELARRGGHGADADARSQALIGEAWSSARADVRAFHGRRSA